MYNLWYSVDAEFYIESDKIIIIWIKFIFSTEIAQKLPKIDRKWPKVVQVSRLHHAISYKNVH